MPVTRTQDIQVALPPWPSHYFLYPTPETLQQCVRGTRAVRLQRVLYGGVRAADCLERWSVQWWKFGFLGQWKVTPQWRLTHEDVKPDLLRAAVRYARAEAALTRGKSVRG